MYMPSKNLKLLLYILVSKRTEVGAMLEIDVSIHWENVSLLQYIVIKKKQNTSLQIIE